MIRILHIFVGFFIFGVTAFCFYRLQFGIDFLDESYYVALPYEFVLGARPFVNESGLHQTAGFISFPFVAFYTTIFGSTGLVLFLRVLFQTFALCAGFMASRFFASSVFGLPKILAIACGALVWLFWPFVIPNFSYNTLCSILFLSGVYAAVTAEMKPSSERRLNQIGSGVAFGLVVLSYPTILIPVGLFTSGLIFLYPSKWRLRLRQSAPFLLALIATGLFDFLLLTLLGWENVFSAIHRHMSTGQQGPSVSKISGLLTAIHAGSGWRIREIFLILVLAAAIGSFKKTRSLVAPFLVALVCVGQWATGPLYLPIYLALIAPIFFILLPKDFPAKRMIALVWICSMAAGLTTSLTSANGFTNAMIGGMAAAILSIFLGLSLVRAHSSKLISTILMAFTIILPLATCLHYMRNSIYGEGYSLAQLTSRITEGPFAGMRTSPHKADFIHELFADLQAAVVNRQSVLFYDDFPAGYLFIDSKKVKLYPMGTSVWLVSDKKRFPQIRQSFADYFQSAENQPDLVFELKDSRWNFYEGNPQPDTDVLTGFFPRLGYRLLQERDPYWLWAKH